MDSPNDNPPLEPRLPDTDDLIFLCRRLNEAGAKYIVVGGFAMIQHGFARATEDIDLLIDTSPENIARVKAAMMALPDGAVREVRSEEHTSELQSRLHLVCRLLLEKKKTNKHTTCSQIILERLDQ